ncbi:ABC transporter ATP-binding protein [Natranaerofaba carboxydovora]|uniref:ABC transporter ATP-binding protein n=1 Tax=Natranaerofaba carboxydovora TaxID=2742683 RepID=UPI001F13253D|nr:ABC transporter ATP-binding protein [Natranaerofaba carboxydovora]UMZ74575.1 putative ABC transporter ATP-binding protein YknY [Natranaerofaba carboxydovora]
MEIVKIENLSKIYNTGEENDDNKEVRALDGINMSIEKGEFVAVVGPSGSGKTTLLSILGGLNNPTKGELIIDDMDVYSLSSEDLADFRRKYVGFVFQDYQLVPYLTAVENVLLPLAVVNMPKKEKIDKALKVLEDMGLDDKANRLPSQLSGGEKERVAIARALVNKPLFILADEPTGSLDSATGKEIMEIFNRLNDEGLTIIMVTHDTSNCDYAKRVISLMDGKVEKEESKEKSPV